MQAENRLISDRLEEERRRLGQTQAQVADLAGVSLSAYKNWKNGGSVPSDALNRLAQAGFDILYVVTGNRAGDSNAQRAAHLKEAPSSYPDQRWPRLVQAEPESAGDAVARHGFVLIPIYDVKVSAGGGNFEHGGDTVQQLAFRSDWVVNHLRRDPSKLAVVEAEGDSMIPTINPGDTLLIDRSERRLTDGIYVVNVNERLMVKRVQALFGGRIRLTSDNESYGPEELRGQEFEQLNVVGRVVWIGRRV